MFGCSEHAGSLFNRGGVDDDGEGFFVVADVLVLRRPLQPPAVRLATHLQPSRIVIATVDKQRVTVGERSLARREDLKQENRFESLG